MTTIQHVFCVFLATVLAGEALGHVLGQEYKPLLTRGTTFLGMGYDLRIGNPDGSSLLRGGIDPGLKLTRNVLQATYDHDKYTEDFCPLEGICTALFSTENRTLLFHDLSQYDEELASYWTVVEEDNETSKLKYAGSGSRVIKDLKSMLENNKHAMIAQDVKWVHGAAEYNRTHIAPTAEFKAELCNLPQILNNDTKTVFRAFLERWGTHVVVQVILGEREVMRTLFTAGDYVRRLFSTLKYKYEVGPSVVNFPNKSYLQFSSRKAALYSMYIMNNDKFSKPLSTLPVLQFGSRSSPIPLSIQVQPISSFIPKSVISESKESCSHVSVDGFNTLRSNVETAIRDYIGNGEEPSRMDNIRLLQLLWPSGTYALPKSRKVATCPESWTFGSRYHDLEDTAPGITEWSIGLNLTMEGRFVQNPTLHFCTKTSPDITKEQDQGLESTWGPGSYCILKKNSCPTHFSTAHAYLNDEDSGNGNKVDGVLPDGVYNTDTRYDFCCRNDGDPSLLLLLPTHHPFFLFPQTSVCQKVNQMKSTMHWLLFDTDNLNPASGGTRLEGNIQPYAAVTSSKDLKLYMCYYESS